MPLYVAPTTRQRFSNYYLLTAGPASASSYLQTPYELLMDMNFPQGQIQFNWLLNNNGSGTTNSSPGTTTAISHGLGFVPNFITLTAYSSGYLYLDPNNPPTTTTFNVLSENASVNFYWKAE